MSPPGRPKGEYRSAQHAGCLVTEPLLIEGLDGCNPLAFMALLGVGSICARILPRVRIGWMAAAGGWRPALHGYGGSTNDFAQALVDAISAAPPSPFDIDNRLPFSRDKLRQAMRKEAAECAQGNRWAVDLLAALGSDAHADEKGLFDDTAFCMVRSGDSAGQGLPAYARSITKDLNAEHVCATLFDAWRYEDDGFSLRWDPVEDQRYALRWGDPSQASSKKKGLLGMKGANALAIEGLAMLPVQPQARGVDTTAIAKLGKLGKLAEFFTWPIWDAPLGADVLRSLLVAPELRHEVPDRKRLRARGIVEVYRCERIASSKYYKNFSPARPA